MLSIDYMDCAIYKWNANVSESTFISFHSILALEITMIGSYSLNRYQQTYNAVLKALQLQHHHCLRFHTQFHSGCIDLMTLINRYILTLNR